MMNKKFNTTGPCVSKKHYMVNIDEKMNKIARMIDTGDYFIINRPRQYGKTTMIYSLDKKLCDKYIVINISFEGIGELILQSEERFSEKILEIMADSIEFTDEDSSEKLRNLSKDVNDLSSLSKVITKFVKNSKKEVILFIDEVDKFSNDRLFLSFLGVLRNKFIASNNDKDYTFKSVILVGVHDVKNLKLKLRQGEDIRLNSPWNIAVNFNIDMNFSIEEIKSMLYQYSELNDVSMDINYIASKLFYYTNGYPFLVSRLCQIIDENKYHWKVENIDLSVKQILKEQNTLFDDLIKNIENNKEIYNFIERILVLGEEIPFVISDVIISLCTTYGIIREDQEKCKINNRIFELYLYNRFTKRNI